MLAAREARREGVLWHKSRRSIQQHHTSSFSKGHRLARGWKSGKITRPLAGVAIAISFWKIFLCIANRQVLCEQLQVLCCETIMVKVIALSMANPLESSY